MFLNQSKQNDLLDLTQKLINLDTCSPDSSLGVSFVENFLKKIGAQTQRFDQNNQGHKTANLLAKIGSGSKIFAFAGHTDVVPPGDFKLWNSPPFESTVKGGILFGRGAVDMKGAIAGFLMATKWFLEETPNPSFSIRFLITGDEEDRDDQGTRILVDFLKSKNEKIEACLIGEPSSLELLGDTIKIGRRGSLSFSLTVDGIQGHVAYPKLAQNPIPKMIDLLTSLQAIELDQGMDFFDASHLELTSIDVGNKTNNIIPSSIWARGNIRFNHLWSQSNLRDFLREKLNPFNCQIDFQGSGEAFLSENLELANVLKNSIEKHLSISPQFSTAGGTSDGRFIRKICSNLAEFGLSSKTAHHINECTKIIDLNNLSLIYYDCLKSFNKNF